MEIDSSSPVYQAVLELFQKALAEDEFIRRDRMRQWVRDHSFWDGLQYTFWDELSSNWRLPPEDVLESLPKVLNYYKAHGESIIAALSSTVPTVRFYPDDADEPFDVETARAQSMLSELIQKHNNGKLLAVKALWTLYNEDYVCSYSCIDSDEKYGSVYTPVFNKQTVQRDNPVCPECGIATQDMNTPCPNCGQMPVNEPYEDEEFILDSYKEQPKSKTKVDMLGALFVKIPYYARCFDDVTWLIKSQEYHYTKLREQFPDFIEYISPGVDTSRYDAWGRMEYKFYMEANLTTLHELWVRPCQFLADFIDEDTRKQLQQSFPRGLHACILGGKANYIITEMESASIDDYWEILFVGTSNYLHGRPIGEGYIQINEMQNELANLTIQTIEYGIPETFADPQTLDLEKYAQREALPGSISSATAPPGQNLGAGFYTIQAATLGDDVEPFGRFLETAGQFITGDVPSVSGTEGKGSRTYGEYSLARTQGLQRLSLYWSAYSWFWAQTMRKSTALQVKAMIDGQFDEKYVERQGTNYVNVWIRQVQLQGKVGKVEPESSETLPISAAQKLDILFKLIELNNPILNEVIYSPENAEFVAQSLGYPDVKIPGEVQRQKQFEEIKVMLMSDPIDMGTGEFMPSVQVEPELDDHVAHIAVCKTFLSQYWSSLRTENPGGYLNIMSHLKAHLALQQQQMMLSQVGGIDATNPTNPAQSEQPVG